jgi:plasmid maintenance system killer protein
VEVTFRRRELERRYTSSRAAIRVWGPVIGPRYIDRIDSLHQIGNVEDLYLVRPYDFHPLTGDRRGQHSMRLTGRVRLIVTVVSSREVIVEEVVDYHG